MLYIPFLNIYFYITLACFISTSFLFVYGIIIYNREEIVDIEDDVEES